MGAGGSRVRVTAMGVMPMRAGRVSAERRALRCRVGDQRAAAGAALRRHARAGVLAVLAALALSLLAAASASAFSAQGSVEQVDVTGLPPNAQASLLKGAATVATQERGLARRPAVPQREAGEELPRARRILRRNLRTDHRPQGHLGAVGSEHLQPGNPGQRIHVSDDARRHAAVDRRAPADQPGGRARRAVDVPLPDAPDPRRAVGELHGAVSDADRVLGIRLCEPGRAGKRHRGGRQPDGLCRGRREHARDRLLRRGFRLLRKAAEPRRLRRDRNDRAPALGASQQGGHARHLLRRHQPAVHGADRSRRASRRSRRCR